MISLLFLLAWNLLAPVLHFSENTVLAINVIACLCPIAEMLVTRFVVKKRWVFLGNLGLCLFLFVVLTYEMNLDKQQKIRVSSQIDTAYRDPYPERSSVGVKVQIANRWFLPSPLRISNLDWDGCIGVFPSSFGIGTARSREGSSLSPQTMAVTCFSPMEATMAVIFSEETHQFLRTSMRDHYSRFLSISKKSVLITVFFDEFHSLQLDALSMSRMTDMECQKAKNGRMRFLSINNLEIPIVETTTKTSGLRSTTDATPSG